MASTGKDRDDRKNITSPESGFVTKVQFHSDGIEAQGCVQRDMHTALDHTCVSAREALLDVTESKHTTAATKTCFLSKVSSLSLTKCLSVVSSSQHVTDAHRIWKY